MEAATCPFHIQILRGLAMSDSDSGSETGGANRICPTRLVEIAAGDFAASAGTFTCCFGAKVVASYSTISLLASRTHRRLPCATRGVAIRSRARVFWILFCIEEICW